MPSNERRLAQNGGTHDSVNYKTTLVLHLKEKEGLASKLEKTEKLIDFDPVHDNWNVPLSLGDEVVWISDHLPHTGTVRWLGCPDGHTANDVLVGVDFDKPVGDSNGIYKKQQLFVTKKNHAAFIPITSLVKADDFFGIPAGQMKKKIKNLKLIENLSNSKLNFRSQPSCTRQSDSLSKNRCSAEPHPWSSTLVELGDVIDSASNGIAIKESVTKDTDKSTSKVEYNFMDSNLHDAEILKVDNAITQGSKDSKNNNIGKKPAHNLGTYPIGKVDPRDYFSNENIPYEDQIAKVSKSSEGVIRHSYSQDLQLFNSANGQLVDNSLQKNKGKSDRKHKNSGASGKTSKLSNSIDSQLEENFSNTDDFQNLRLSKSPSLGSDSSSLYDASEPSQSYDLDVGSVVEVTVNGEPRYGVIRWIGIVPEDKKARKIAGIEMEEEHVGYTDGTFNGRRYFQCNPRKAMFVNLSMCQKDGRFQEMQQPNSEALIKTFGQVQCPVIPGAVKPVTTKGDLESLCGKYRGIQGHHNSCYLDATLFSMFTFTSVFDSLLFRPPNENDVSHYQEVQRVLREEIVNPLRQNLYVRADRVMKLRTLLENLSSVTGLTSEEKDPEEFLTSLVAQILRAEPFLKLNSGQEAYHYQLFVEKDEQLTLPSVQQLFEQSFLAGDIKLKEVPSCLIIQMPRFGKSFKMYPRILPSQLLDVTDIIEDSPRQCTVCGKLAEFECKECFGEFGVGLESIAFCPKCLERAHSHQRRSTHAWRHLDVPMEFSILQDHCPVPRLYMELFAVVCIETSHYVAFVKCGSGSDAPWCFFDSMADRKGEQNGYNIPEMVSCPNLPYWLSDEGARSLHEMKDDRQLPEHAKRLLCDAYMCMYQSPDVMMYR